CETMARKLIASCARTAGWPSCGKKSAKRVTAPLASRVCSVVKTRWPVSAAESAIDAGAGSRISATRSTAGAARERTPRGVPTANLPAGQHVRFLPQAVLEPVGEGEHVEADLALRDDRVR